MDREKERLQERKLKYKSENFRAEQDESGIKKIKGYPILFNVPGKPYFASDWKEVIDQRALDDVDFSETRLLVNHDDALLLAKAGINMTYKIDDLGLFIDADLPNTTLANDTFELVSRNIMDGMSFRFYADRWETDIDNKIDRVMHITLVPEVSIVTFAAYPQTVVIATADIQQQQEQRNETDVNEAAHKRALAELDILLTF